MNQEASYALLAADSYRDARSVARNYAPIDPAWIELKDYAKSGSGANAQLPEGGFRIGTGVRSPLIKSSNS